MDWFPFVRFLHVAGVFVFLLAHGASANVALQLRRERKPERIRALLDLSVQSYLGMYAGILLLLVTGITAGFVGNYWGRGWIWLAIIVLVAIFVVMGVVGSLHYSKIRTAVGLQPYRRTDQVTLGEVKNEQEIAALVDTNRPVILWVIGLVGILIILWLMMFKPF